jgi:hypothetical protein
MFAYLNNTHYINLLEMVNMLYARKVIIIAEDFQYDGRDLVGCEVVQHRR